MSQGAPTSRETRRMSNPFERLLTLWVALCIGGGEATAVAFEML